MQTLGADYDEIQQEMGYFLGWGRTVSAWSTDQLASITTWIKSGLRRFMFAATVPGMKNVYEWSFLQHDWRFGTQVGQTEYDLPKDFGSPGGPIIWDSPTISYQPIPFVNEAMVRQKLSLTPGWSGVPVLAAVFSKRTGGATEQQQGLLLCPVPDASYPLRLSYDILPGMLTESFPWPAGGSPHARTVLYACMAEACKRGDDNSSYEQDYQQALAASINYDARRKGDNVGYNSDKSNRPRDWTNYDGNEFTDLRVKYNGVQF